MRLLDWVIEKKLFEPEYIIRELEPQAFEVTKWTHGTQPDEIYRVEYTERYGKKYWRCSCPARGVCKHIKMVQDWIKKGKKPYIDISSKEVKNWLKRYGI